MGPADPVCKPYIPKLYIYITYIPNLGLEIAVSVRDREQGRFRGSNEGARVRSKGASGEHGGASREH